jgi:hypothetical protein
MSGNANINIAGNVVVDSGSSSAILASGNATQGITGTIYAK